MKKKDIVELGWNFEGGKLRADFLDTFEKDNYILEYKYDKNYLTIIYTNPMLFEEVYDYRFKGVVESKEELILLMKMIGIK